MGRSDSLFPAIDFIFIMTSQITDFELDKLKIGDPVVSKFRRIREEGKTGVIQYGYKFVPDVGL